MLSGAIHYSVISCDEPLLDIPISYDIRTIPICIITIFPQLLSPFKYVLIKYYFWMQYGKHAIIF